jgi:hypothetical protein
MIDLAIKTDPFVLITNVDGDNLYEVMVFDEDGEKIFETKVKKFYTELLPINS